MSTDTPRPSASLIVLNSRNEVLLVQRNPLSRSFGNMHVFPGGNLDPGQDTSHEDTAIRETFEEAGILLATPKSGAPPSDLLLDEARKLIHKGELKFHTFLNNNGLVVDNLYPFTQWITPKNIARRFHTHFYLAFLKSPTDLVPGETRIPTSDGGLEVISTSMGHPSAHIEDFLKGKINLMPPQFYLLKTLAEILPSDSTFSPKAFEQLKRLSRGTFGRIQINPSVFRHESDPLKSYFVYEGDEALGGPKGQRHRSVVCHDEKRVIRSIELQRNFDIFSNFFLSSPEAKL